MTQRLGNKAGLGMVALCLTLGMGLVGCAPEPGSPEVSATPDAPGQSATPPGPSASPTATPTPSPAASAAPISIPECAVLVTESQAREFAGLPAYAPVDAATASNLRTLALERVLGPASVTALGDAAHSVHCAWGIPNSGAVTQLFVSSLDQSTMETLRAELDASAFIRGEDGDVVTYTLSEEGGISPMHQFFAFRGTVWVIEIGSLPDTGFGRAALAVATAAS
ncbi:hypothetical protein [Leucobacter luti]|nr:hypothetical protein [Leucobacter luti]